MKKPKLILADEPTANLDSQTSTQIMQLLLKLKDEMGTTVLVATHDSSIARLAKRTLHLVDGRLNEMPQVVAQAV